MNWKKGLIGFTILILMVLGAGYLYINWAFRQPCPPPEKPSTVPSGAVWKGGCDGGNWIELISINNGKYRFRIYRDWDGVLEMDADFQLVECNTVELNFSNWILYTSAYLNESIGIDERLSENINCHLKAVFPAYGGEEWEILKEKYPDAYPTGVDVE